LSAHTTNAHTTTALRPRYRASSSAPVAATRASPAHCARWRGVRPRRHSAHTTAPTHLARRPSTAPRRHLATPRNQPPRRRRRRRSYEGELRAGAPAGRGAEWLPHGARRFEGDWARGHPLRGTAVDADGAVSLAAFDGAAPLSPATWARATHRPWGRLAPWPPPPGAPGGPGGPAEWEVAAARGDGGGEFAGRMRGLCPLRGVETDAAGRRRRVEYAGDVTLAEDPEPVFVEVG
jgi:hypothetical protein